SNDSSYLACAGPHRNCHRSKHGRSGAGCAIAHRHAGQFSSFHCAFPSLLVLCPDLLARTLLCFHVLKGLLRAGVPALLGVRGASGAAAPVVASAGILERDPAAVTVE